MSHKFDTIIIDDSNKSIDVLKNDLSAYECINVIATTSDIKEAEKTILELKPDILFIDIEMPQKNGLDFVSELKRKIDFTLLVIFYSAFEHYLIDMLRLAAFDFLQKPYFPDELDAIIKRIENHFAVDNSQSTDNYTLPNSIIGMQTDNSIEIINNDEITLFQYDGTARIWQMLYSNGKYYNLRKNLKAKDIINLNNKNFIQINKSCIVNIKFVNSIENQTLQCLLTPPFEEIELFISRTYYPKLKEKLKII